MTEADTVAVVQDELDFPAGSKLLTAELPSTKWRAKASIAQEGNYARRMPKFMVVLQALQLFRPTRLWATWLQLLLA